MTFWHGQILERMLSLREMKEEDRFEKGELTLHGEPVEGDWVRLTNLDMDGALTSYNGALASIVDLSIGKARVEIQHSKKMVCVNRDNIIVVREPLSAADRAQLDATAISLMSRIASKMDKLHTQSFKSFKGVYASPVNVRP